MRRHCGWLVTACLALAPGAGCLTGYVDSSTSRSAPPKDAPTATRVEAELTPASKAEFFLAMARGLEKHDDGRKAAVCYEQAIALKPESADDIAHHLAVLYDKIDEPAKSLIEFERALKKHPKDAGLLNDLGYHWYNRGDWVQAEIYYRKALELEPRLARAQMNLGLTLAQQGRTQEALETFRKVVGPAEAQTNLGFVLLTQGKREEARAAYSQALALDPSCRLAQTALAKLAQNRPDGGVTHDAAAPPAPESRTP